MATKIKINHLKEHLFEQLERLNDFDLTEKQDLTLLTHEIQRAKAVRETAKVLVDIARIEADFITELGMTPHGGMFDGTKYLESK